jgi:transposase
VKAYLKRSKNDASDAAAICEAVTRPSMRFVPTAKGSIAYLPLADPKQRENDLWKSQPTRC